MRPVLPCLIEFDFARVLKSFDPTLVLEVLLRIFLRIRCCHEPVLELNKPRIECAGLGKNVAQFAFDLDLGAHSGEQPEKLQAERMLKLVEESRAAFSKLGGIHDFEYFQVTDLGVSRDGKFDPESLLSNFSDEHAPLIQNKTNLVDSGFYRVLEKTVVPFGWQVSTGKKSGGDNSDKTATADASIFDFLSGFNIQCGYSVPVYSPRRGRAVVNYFNTSGEVTRHYPGLMFETIRLFESYFRPVESAKNAQGSQLNEVQKRCLAKLATGMTPEEIGLSIGLSQHAIDAIIRSVVHKLDARSIGHAVALAVSGFHIEI